VGVEKALIAIATAVIGSVLVWWLTASGGMLNPKAPDLKILSVHVENRRSILLGSREETFPASATVTVHNEGNSSANHCRAQWRGFSIADDIGSSLQSDEFGLTPSATTTVVVRGPGKKGFMANTFVQVRCANAESEAYPESVFIY
jgi:hypothetical protein